MIMYICICLSLLLSLISMPLIIKFCKKFSLYDYQNSRKIHSGDIPRLGGVGIVLSFLISVVIYFKMSKDIDIVNHLPILIATTIIFLFALLDDLLDLPAVLKLIVQLIAVSIVCFNGYNFKQVFGLELPKIIRVILTFGWILGLVNAYNLIDGLDGLCGNLSITTIITLGILFSFSGNEETGLCFILAGSIFGFLCFNKPPAKLFMGDGGSQFLGFMIATIPLYTSSDVFEHNKFIIMLVLTSIPVFDTIAAIWRRLRDRKPLMTGDRSHLHHKLLNLEYSKKSVLVLITFIQILLCVSVIISYFLGESKGQALLFETIAFMILFFSIVHYSNRRKCKEQNNQEKLSDNGDTNQKDNNNSNGIAETAESSANKLNNIGGGYIISFQ